MGVTIHYAGQLRNESDLQHLLSTAEEYARSRGWSFSVVDSGDGPGGFVLFPHPDCEPLEIKFEKRNRFSNWVKTQFAGPEIHVQVVQFLRQIKPILGRLGVRDEGEFWNTGDDETLRWHMNQTNEVIAEMIQENPGIRSNVKTPDGRIVDVIK